MPSTRSLILREFPSARIWIALVVLAGLVNGILAIALAVVLSTVLSQAFESRLTLAAATPLLLLVVAIAVGRGLMMWTAECAGHAGARRVISQLRAHLLRSLAARGPAALIDTRTGALATASTTGLDALDIYFSGYLPQLVLSAVVPTLVLVYLVTTDLLSALIVFVTLPLIPLFMWLVGSAAQHRIDRRWALLQRLSAYFLDVVEGLPDLRIFGRADAQIDRIRAVTAASRKATMSTLAIAFLSSMVLEILASISTALVAAVIGLRLVDGAMNLQTGLAVLIVVPEAYMPLRQLGTYFHSSKEGMTAAATVLEVTEGTSGTVAPVPPAKAGRADSPRTSPALDGSPSRPAADPGTIRFSGVTSIYDARGEGLVHPVDLTIPAGTTTLIAGPSGAGKTTLLSLLIRFISPTSGSIAVNGSNLSDLDVNAWRERLGWVSQHPWLFSGTVLENIRLAAPNVPASEVDAILASLFPDGSISSSTRLTQNGEGLSGGERVRLALARALARRPALLLLDEPTAFLDPVARDAVLSVLRETAAGGASLVVATHEPERFDWADQELVLEPRSVAAEKPAVSHDASGMPRLRSPESPPNDRSGQLADIEGGSSKLDTRLPAEGPFGRAAPNATKPAESSRSESFKPNMALTARAMMTRFIVGERLRIAGAVAAGVLTILSSVCLLAVSAYLIERASQRPPILSLEVAIVSVRFFGISRGIFRYLDRYLSHDASFRLLGDIRAEIYRRLIPLAPAGLDRFGRGDVLSRIAADVDTMQEWFVRGFAPLATSIVTAVVLIVAAAVILPAAGAALMVALFGAALAILLVTRSGGGSEARELELRGELTARTVEYIHGLADLTAMGAAVRMADGIDDLEDRRAGLTAARARRNAFAVGLQSALPGLVAALLAAVSIAALAQGLNPLFVGVLVFGGMGAVECVMAVSPGVAAWERGHAAARRLAGLTSDAGIAIPSGSVDLRSAPRTLTVLDLSFRYGPSSPYVLRDISLDLTVGEQVIIVGPSGVGKSTLASLLLRFLSPNGGEIAVNGVDLSTLSEDSVRHTCGAATQQAHLFAGTILENVKLARPEAADSEVRVALEQARLGQWVAGLPEGWNTQVGEHGKAVSGGQRRRIALARAFLAGFPILIADEPTEGLDEWTAREVMETLFSQSSGLALIVITHRPDLCPPGARTYELAAGRLNPRRALIPA